MHFGSFWVLGLIVTVGPGGIAINFRVIFLSLVGLGLILGWLGDFVLGLVLGRGLGFGMEVGRLSRLRAGKMAS